MTQGVRGGTGIDAAGGAGQAVGALDAALAHGAGVEVHGLAEAEGAVGPTPARGGKEQRGVLVRAPPGAQLLDHGGSDRDIALLAAFAVADQQTRRLLASQNVFDLDADGFADAQPAVVHEAQASAEARLAHGGQEAFHFRARQHDGQHLRLGHAHLPEDGPAGDLEALDVEAEQRVFSHLHRAAGVVLVLAQEQEVLPELVFREGGRIALEMLGQLADIPDVLFLGRLAVIFKLDELLEFGDRGIVNMHKPGRMSLREGNFPANRRSQPMQSASLSHCREAAQFNHPAAGKAGIASLLPVERRCPGLPEPGR